MDRIPSQRSLPAAGACLPSIPLGTCAAAAAATGTLASDMVSTSIAAAIASTGPGPSPSGAAGRSGIDEVVRSHTRPETMTRDAQQMAGLVLIVPLADARAAAETTLVCGPV